MTFEDELGNLLRQAGAAHTLPTPAGADTVTARYQRRHRRRTSIGGIAAALVLAVASYGVFRATVPDESSTVATVPDSTTAIVDGDGADAPDDALTGEATDAALEPAAAPEPEAGAPENPGPIVTSAELVDSISSIMTVDGGYIGFSSIPAFENGTPTSQVVAVESLDGENWVASADATVPDDLAFVMSLTEGDGAWFMVGGTSGVNFGGPGAMFISTDQRTWTEVTVPGLEPRDGMIVEVNVLSVAHGPAGFLAVVDVYEEVDPERFGLDVAQICSVSGTKATDDATEAKYSVFLCGPNQDLETITVDVPADFQPHEFGISEPSFRVFHIGDGSAPELVEGPPGVAFIAGDDDGYMALLTVGGQAAFSSSNDGRTWTPSDAPGGDPGAGNSQPSPGRLVSIGDRMLLIESSGLSTRVFASDDFGATWSEVALPTIDGVDSVIVQVVTSNEHGVGFTAVDATSMDAFGPGRITFEFVNDGFTFRTAEADPLMFEVVDPDGVVIKSLPTEALFSFDEEVDGILREANGWISILDDDGETIVGFHANQAMQQFESVTEGPATTGSVTIEKEGYVLDMVPEGEGMLFTLIDDEGVVETWVVGDEFESQPGLEFNDVDDAIFSDPISGEVILTITDAEGQAAFESAMDAGEFSIEGLSEQALYVFASRDGLNWDIAGQVDGFGGSMTVGEDEVVVVAYGMTGAEVAVLPMPGG